MTTDFDHAEPDTVRPPACTVQQHADLLGDPTRLRREAVYAGFWNDPVEPFHMWNCPRCRSTLGSLTGPETDGEAVARYFEERRQLQGATIRKPGGHQ